MTLRIMTLSMMSLSITKAQHSRTVANGIVILSVINAECHLWWMSFMLNIIYAECHLCWMSFMLNVIYAEYHLCWVLLCWVSQKKPFMLSVVMPRFAMLSVTNKLLCWVSLFWVSWCWMSWRQRWGRRWGRRQGRRWHRRWRRRWLRRRSATVKKI